MHNVGNLQYNEPMSEKRILKNIASEIQEARKNLRYKQSDVAKAAGIEVNYYAKIERGEAVPSLVTLIAIANFLEIKTIIIS
jgi:transcriptional regulator with XRE-family HTH domain